MSELKEVLGQIDVILNNKFYTSQKKAERLHELIKPVSCYYRIFGIIFQVLEAYKSSGDKLQRIQEILKLEFIEADDFYKEWEE